MGRTETDVGIHEYDRIHEKPWQKPAKKTQNLHARDNGCK